MKNKKTVSYAVAALAVAVLFAQDPPTDRVAVAFSDPSRPGMINVSLISGSITVKGYSGKEVIVEARSRGDKSAPAEAGGMKRVVVGSTGLSVEEENNTMTVRAASHARTVDITIQVPAKTSLKLRALNSGEIKVEGVEGEIEANHLNGPVTLAGIAGSAVAHSLNGKVLVSFTRVEPKKAMSFSSMNGTIDVTFPADLRANVKMRSDRGDIFTDFDIQMQPDAAKPVVEDARGKGGRYRVKVDSGMSGAINGGGAEIQFKNHNGPIYIRKAK